MHTQYLYGLKLLFSSNKQEEIVLSDDWVMVGQHVLANPEVATGERKPRIQVNKLVKSSRNRLVISSVNSASGGLFMRSM